ncbi:cytochrome P450 [Byssothecium circinans]|uniref:Cytochrome P450 n=1 Tax=Byssothecium circinans TaxID=147558 RepID=A0A6A5TIG8_9PLEO|nr:cytochrome P450 [Byssothecium circinans]
MFENVSLVIWLAASAGGIIILRSAVNRLYEELRIWRLGGHARKIWPWNPFGLYFTYAITSHALRDENLKFMHNCCQSDTQANSRQSNTFEWRMGGERFIMTSDKENIKAILATQFNDYGKRQKFRKGWGRLLGLGIFASDGERWHDARHRLRPLFTRQRIADLACFERHVQNMLPMLGQGRVMDMKDLFNRLFLDITVDFTFGRRLDTLSSKNGDFFETFQRILHTQSLIERAGPFNFAIPRKQLHNDISIVESVLEPSIQEALAIPEDVLKNLDSKDNSLSFVQQCAALTRDPKFLRDEMLGVLIAGRDPTANTLSWCLYELARNPAVTKELRKIIEETVGLDRKPTLEEVKGIKMVSHILQETLRLYPVLPSNVRAALSHTTLPRRGGAKGDSPVGVPAGTTVYYSTQLLPFPPPDEFAPSRWGAWTPEPWTYIPFNGGPRICVGQTFALTEMVYVLVRLFQRYRSLELVGTKPDERVGGWWRVDDEASVVEKLVGRTVRMASEVTLSPKHPVNVRFVE